MPPSRASSAVDHAAALLRQFEIEPKPLDRLLAAYLTRHRELHSRDRRAVADLLFNVMRFRSRIDGQLRLAGQQQIGHADRARALADDPEFLSHPMPPRFPGGPAAWHAFPDFLFQRFVQQHGAEGAAALAEAMNAPALPVLRVNTLKCSRAEALQQLLEEGIDAVPTERSPYGIRLGRRADVQQLAPFKRGWLEIQDEASQLAVLLAGPRPGERVLDACSGAGGKALMMAMLMQGSGVIVAAEQVREKLAELNLRARRAGVSMIREQSGDLLKAQFDEAPFDLVFLDAPCSGTGTLRRAPDLKWRLQEGDLDAFCRLQARILRACKPLVRPGGRLLYATCSLLSEENEQVVKAFLAEGGFRVADARAGLSGQGIEVEALVSPEGFLRMDPRQGNWDGFFAALLIRG